MKTDSPYIFPDPNDPNSIEAHKLNVLSAFDPLFTIIELALRDSVPQATNVFSLLEGPVEPTVHAAITRYLCKRYLSEQQVATEEEVEIEIDQVANCGLCINQKQSQIRILKSTPVGIPKATSEARRRFYSSNQYLIPFEGSTSATAQSQTSLSLIVLWTLGEKFSFKGMEIACPRGEREDGNVDCYWIASWKGNAFSHGVPQLTAAIPDTDLDEIKPIEERKKASS